MRIYSKPAFAVGVFCGCLLLLGAFGIISSEWWAWLCTLVGFVRFLYIGLSKKAGEKANLALRRRNETAVRLYGKYALVKIGLPYIVFLGFPGAVLFVRHVLDINPPVRVVAGIYVILLAVSVFYSKGLTNEVEDTIMAEEADSQKQR